MISAGDVRPGSRPAMTSPSSRAMWSGPKRPAWIARTMSTASARAPARESTTRRRRCDEGTIHLADVRTAGADRADMRAVCDPGTFDDRTVEAVARTMTSAPSTAARAEETARRGARVGWARSRAKRSRLAAGAPDTDFFQAARRRSLRDGCVPARPTRGARASCRRGVRARHVA